MTENDVVWLIEERVFALLIQIHAYFSTVLIPGVGITQIDNDDYELWEKRSISFESDE